MLASQVYRKYCVPPGLQKHLLRVAGVGFIIASNWKSYFPTKDIVIKTLLLHDVANVIKFDLSNYAFLLKDPKNSVAYWKNIQKKFVLKYGTDEHKATIKIAKEIGVSKRVIHLLKSMIYSHPKEAVSKKSWPLKICVLADGKVSPLKVTTIDERFDEIVKRYKQTNHLLANVQEVNKKRVECLVLEKQIQKKVSIDLPGISESSVKILYKKLLNYKF